MSAASLTVWHLGRLLGRGRQLEEDRHRLLLAELELEQADRLRSTSARSTRLGTTSVAVSSSSTGCSA